MIPTLLVDALATHRLTRLVTDDTLIRPLRQCVIRWAYTHRDTPLPSDELPAGEWIDMPYEDLMAVDGDDAPRLAYLVTCRWCTSIWVAAAVVAARRCFPRAWSIVADALALSTCAATLSRWEP